MNITKMGKQDELRKVKSTNDTLKMVRQQLMIPEGKKEMLE